MLCMQLIERLPPVEKARLLMALLGIVLLGLGMILMIVLGGRYVRRLSRTQAPLRSKPEETWYRKPSPSPSNTGEQHSE
jgi:hypothetical protein